MSESMTTVEIEDVLSSIRRLVSEDLRPTHKLVSAALQRGATKLILTPALRIVSDVRTALPESGAGLDDQPDLQTVLLEIEAESEDAQVEILPVFGSVRLVDHSVMSDSADDTAGPPDATFLTSAMSRITGLAGVDAAAASHPDRIEAVVAAVGAAVGPDEWEPDGGEPAPQEKAWDDAVWNHSGESDAASSELAFETGDCAADGLAVVAKTDIADMGVVATEAGQTDPGPVDTGGDQGTFAGADSIVFQDPITNAPATPLPDTAEPSDDLDESAAFVSEDLLREIVRDMVREELQGNLGERITRNVRKLVRAEISRALASRDFDNIAHRG